jgi:hypothetical protein
MGKSKNLSRSPLVLTQYDELTRYGEAFAGGHLNLLILTGGPGLGKSWLIKSLVGPDACWIDGHTTAFGMYVRLYKHRGRPVVIDDVDDLHNNREAVRLLKSLCQTDREKTISWNSGTPENQRDYPQCLFDRRGADARTREFRRFDIGRHDRRCTRRGHRNGHGSLLVFGNSGTRNDGRGRRLNADDVIGRLDGGILVEQGPEILPSLIDAQRR